MATTSSSTSPAAPQIRAIHTSLTSRPVPSIPPPTQTYIPLAKQILRHRLIQHVFVYSLISCWSLSTIWEIANAENGGKSSSASVLLLAPFRLNTILWAVMLWSVLALPEVVLRKRFLTSKPTKAASPQELFKEGRKKRSTKIALVTYLVSAVCFLVLHITFMEGSNHRLRLFVKSKKHPFYLNPRFIYLLFSQFSVALVYSLSTILQDRSVFKISQSPRLLTLPTLLQTIFICILLSLLSFPLSSLLVLLSRLVILPLLYRVPLFPQILRPFTAHFLKTPLLSLSHPISSFVHTILLPLTHLPLIFRSWAIAYTTLFTWEIATTLFSSSISRPIKVSHLVADPNLTLVSGISVSSSAAPETDGYPFHYNAYLELRDLASASDSPHASAQRSVLFADQKYTPSLWSRLVRESLFLLGKDYQLLVHRGNPPPPAVAATPASTVSGDGQTASSLPFQTTPVKLISQPSSAFRPVHETPVKSVFDSLASDGPLAKAVEFVGEEAETVAQKMPELFRSVRGATSTTPLASGSGASGRGTVVVTTTNKSGLDLMDRAKMEVRKRLVAVANEITPGWVQQVGSEVQEWWTRERVHKKVEMVLANKEVDLVVVDVLSHFVCASLTEDTFGVVQRDIPKILEAMARCLGEVEGWRAQLAASTPSPSIPTPTPDQNQNQTAGDQDTNVQDMSPKQIRDQLELDAAKALLSELSDGLKEGIGRIVRTFGDKLTAFRFPPVVANSLQGFLDYCT